MTRAMPSLDGRTFRDATTDHVGDVSAETCFEYHEEGDVVWTSKPGTGTSVLVETQE